MRLCSIENGARRLRALLGAATALAAAQCFAGDATPRPLPKVIIDAPTVVQWRDMFSHEEQWKEARSFIGGGKRVAVAALTHEAPGTFGSPGHHVLCAWGSSPKPAAINASRQSVFAKSSAR